MTITPAASPQSRFDAIDVARGAAIAAMVIYHFSWDLTALQFIATDVTREPGWRLFARTIATSFLALVGIGLVLAHAQGLRRGPFLRRLARVGGAALLITAVTYAAFPQSYIFFGILHCIAVGSVLALPFLRAPVWLVVAVAALCVAAPWILTDPVFDRPALEWLGLGSQDPTTNDYVPVFPWLAPILIGLVLGRFLTGRRASRLAQWRARDALSRALVWAGRRSLPIYLIHQVILFGALSGVREIVGPNPVAQCTQDCARRSGDAAACRASCTCVVGVLRERGALDRIMAGPPGEADQAILDEAARMCRRRP